MADVVTVPEFIVVHLGRPEAAAQNVTVSFPDYVKNVASSEIYPTWPQSALLANIYAIISFALNRIFLEYYRAQGYNFDITNSTSIDQSYVQGRNIFSNISDLVDEVFNNYVRIIGRLEPLSTRFCNGTTVTCSGLSQWGTVDLAEQNYSTFDILRYYYGDNIEIVYNAPVGGLSPSYPETPLRLGDVNVNVFNAQILLNRISDNYPAIPKIYPVDGVFDEEMEQAIIKFQQIFKLNADGVIGKQTWYKMAYLFTGILQLTELESEGVILSQYPKFAPVEGNMAIQAAGEMKKEGSSNTILYSEGDTGEQIQIIQYWLGWISAFFITVPYVPISGVYDASTTNAVLQFQKEFSLPQTGDVNLATWDALYSVYAGILDDSREHIDAGLIQRLDAPLKLGDSGSQVTELQRKLNTARNLYPEIPGILETGSFGQRTRIGVQILQRKYGLTANGVVDKETWNKIGRAEDSFISSVSPAALQYPGFVLKSGMSDMELRKNKQTLTTPIYHLNDGIRQMSFGFESIPTIVPQHQYNEDTAAAVRAVQKLGNLPQTGEIDFKTMEFIREWNA